MVFQSLVALYRVSHIKSLTLCTRSKASVRHIFTASFLAEPFLNIGGKRNQKLLLVQQLLRASVMTCHPDGQLRCEIGQGGAVHWFQKGNPGRNYTNDPKAKPLKIIHVHSP